VTRPNASPDATIVVGLPSFILNRKNACVKSSTPAVKSASVLPIPNTCFLEEGGRHPNIADKRAFKGEVDPEACLTGKMKTYPHNPSTPCRSQKRPPRLRRV